MFTCQLLHPNDAGYGETPACWLLHCWVMWTTVRSLQGSARAVQLRLSDRCSTMMERLMPFHWSHMIWSWLKLMPTKGRGRWRTGRRRNHTKWYTRLPKASLPYLMKNQWMGGPWILHQSWLFLTAPPEGTPLCMVMWAERTRCTATTLGEHNSR